MLFKLVLWIGLAVAWMFFYQLAYNGGGMELQRDFALRQFESADTPTIIMKESKTLLNVLSIAGVIGWFAVGYGLFHKELGKMMNGLSKITALFLLCFSMTGCYIPYQPIKLQELGTNEEGFLIPYTGDTTKQTTSNNEEFLSKNMVLVKQITIPQQWIQTGYRPWMGHWADAAILIKVDKAPVTREWTAEENSGTSAKNEAIWGMTSDQVLFSTGWTCTARINSKDDAVKFLHNYPNGSLVTVLDTEVRAKIQALFSMEVTDIPMDEMKINATPHLQKIINETTSFFEKRGLGITNLGITGGFVYKDPSIHTKLVEVFNSEQEKNINVAKTQAQEEMNKKIMLEATGKANALLTEKRAEAEGIKAVADAKEYELQKAKQDLQTYLSLKRLEVEVKKTEKWNGVYPSTYFGKDTPDMLLNLPVDKK